MGLKHITFPEATIEFPGGNFAVRGLSLDAIMHLFQRHGEKLQEVFTELTKGSGEVTTETVAALALPLLRLAPDIAADLIACGSGAPEDADIAAKLPLPVQLEALEQIVTLTFAAEGGPKKLLETVIRMAEGTTGLLSSLGAPQA